MRSPTTIHLAFGKYSSIMFNARARTLHEFSEKRSWLPVFRHQEIKQGEFLGPILVTVNDRAATRDAIIKGVRALKATFVERSSWKALDGKTDMVMDWDYTMIALHHAGRSHSCTPGVEQMQEIQKGHLSQKYVDIGYYYGIDCTGRIFEGRDIRFQGSTLPKYNTGLIGIVLLDDLTTPEEGGDWVAKVRVALDSIGYSAKTSFPKIKSLR